jgi:hypothetical protein
MATFAMTLNAGMDEPTSSGAPSASCEPLSLSFICGSRFLSHSCTLARIGLNDAGRRAPRRYSIETVRRSTQSNSRSCRTKEAVHELHTFICAEEPNGRLRPCWARTVNGHAAAVLPRNLTNSRRFMGSAPGGGRSLSSPISPPRRAPPQELAAS